VIRFWPATEPAQLDYERLRERALAGVLLLGPEAERFRRGGLATLIRKPSSPTPALVACLTPVARPRWSPYEDPRLTALANAYDLLRSAAQDLDPAVEDAR
jgi:hypothetical protein